MSLPTVDNRSPRSPFLLLGAPWLLYSLLAVLFWGLWGLESKFVVDRMSPWLNQVVFSFGLLPAVIWIFATRKKASLATDSSNQRRGALYGIATGILGGGGNVAFYLALARGGKASVVVPLVGLAPLATVLLALVVLKEALNRAQIVGLVFALISIFLLSL